MSTQQPYDPYAGYVAFSEVRDGKDIAPGVFFRDHSFNLCKALTAPDDRGQFQALNHRGVESTWHVGMVRR